MKISVITVTLNHLAGLEATWRSVAAQTYRDFEWVVIDGGSTDGTTGFLEAHAGEIAYWVSEPDGGIYQAMNKGVAQARGEYCIFMNAGDVFYDERVLEDMAPYLDGQMPMVFGETVYPDGWIHRAIPGVRPEYFWGSSFPHQAAFMHRDLFERYGKYREEYRYASDMFYFYELIFRHKVEFRAVERQVCRFEGGGVSANRHATRDRWRYIVHDMGFPDNLYYGLLELYEPVRQRFFPNFSFSRIWCKNNPNS